MAAFVCRAVVAGVQKSVHFREAFRIQHTYADDIPATWTLFANPPVRSNWASKDAQKCHIKEWSSSSTAPAVANPVGFFRGNPTRKSTDFICSLLQISCAAVSQNSTSMSIRIYLPHHFRISTAWLASARNSSHIGACWPLAICIIPCKEAVACQPFLHATSAVLSVVKLEIYGIL